jgi:hypothetical protein
MMHSYDPDGGAIVTLIEKTEQEKMLGSSPNVNPWLRFAQIVSYIANPLVVAFPLYLVVALATAPTIIQGLLWWMVTAIGVSAAPLLFVWRGVRNGSYTDYHVSQREQRLIPLLFALGCMAMVFVLLLLLKASLALLATVTAMITSMVVALMITQLARWKISLHLIGMTGAIITLGIIVGTLLFFLAPLILLVGWAGWLVRAHTLLQACAGAALGGSISVVIFWFFGVL